MQRVQCEFCRKDVWRKESYIKRYSHFYCDRECRFEHQRSLQPRVKCSACNKEIILDGRRRKNSKTGLYFCNNDCKNPYIARVKRWAKNPLSYRKRRPRIIKVAGGKCQNCEYNENERMLDIHHNDGNHRNNDWKNLRCLCVWCHTGFHRGVIKLKNLKSLTCGAW